jgi:hypothetical protein
MAGQVVAYRCRQSLVRYVGHGDPPRLWPDNIGPLLPARLDAGQQGSGCDQPRADFAASGPRSLIIVRDCAGAPRDEGLQQSRKPAITMSAFDIARRHAAEAFEEARGKNAGTDIVGRHLIDAVITEFLKTRSVDDVRRELLFIAENVDPETDYIFMRP